MARLRAVQERAAPGRSPVRLPRATIISAPSGDGRCSVKATSPSAVSHALISALVVRITGMGFGWIALTSAFGSVVRKARRSLVASPFLEHLAVHASSIVPTIVDGHYPRAALRALSPSAPCRPPSSYRSLRRWPPASTPPHPAPTIARTLVSRCMRISGK